MTTKPRHVVPGRSVSLSRRTHGRRVMIAPDHETRENFLYEMALTASRTQTKPYFATLLGTHYHFDGFDSDGNYPSFMQGLNSGFAKAMNKKLDRHDSFWSGDGYQPCFPQDANDVLRRIEYNMSNPLAADLVSRLDDYPYYQTHPDDIGRDIVCRRPETWRSDDGRVAPPTLVLRFEKPPELDHLTMEEYRQLLREMRARVEAEHRERRKREGKSVVGAKRLIRDFDPEKQPKSPRKKSRIRPEVAARDKAKRIAALQLLKQFREDYSKAIQRFNEGEYDVTFPQGTWGMRKHNVFIAEAPKS